MSLYSMMFGINPWAGLCLQVLNIKPADVPRFRDAFIDEETGNIVIYTRTGGGNRPYYDNQESWSSMVDPRTQEEADTSGPWNDDLRELPGYKYDKDDGYDSTYAYFFFEPAEEWKPILKTAKELISTPDPRKKWESLIEDLRKNKGNPVTPEGKRALEVGKTILAQLDAIIPQQ